MSKPIDPIKFAKLCWPGVTFFKEQWDVIYSVLDNDETIVPAGNMLGKDFVAGFLAVWFFMAYEQVRIVTTSVKDDHLRVLWGEIGRFINTSKYALNSDVGGPWIVNHRDIRKVIEDVRCDICYIRGMVSAKGEGMAGHHAEHTLAIIDEASGVDNEVYTQCDTWADTKLIIGNPNPCTNFFFSGVMGGNKPSGRNGHLYVNVIKIKAQDAPNVRLGEAQKARGEEPTNEILVPGVLSYQEYVKRRELWDKVRQCIGLDGEFPMDPSILLYPPLWLNHAEKLATESRAKVGPTVLGVDSAQGGDNTAWAVGDNSGLIKLISRKTPDTSVIPGDTLALMREYNIEPENVLFDMGGGGQQHVDQLRSRGYNVRAIAFGGAASPDRRLGLTILEERKHQDETRYVYKNRRAEMYGLLRLRLDPSNERGWAMPREIIQQQRSDGGPSLRNQLAMMPLRHDGEGRLVMLPKTKKKDATEECLTDIIGCSPDEADAVVLLIFGLNERGAQIILQPAF